MTAFVISKDGETQHVLSLDGYDDWTVVAELDRCPGAFEMVVDGAIVLDVAALDVELHARIDREAGAVRCRYITDIPGQEATYLKKEQKARAYLTSEDPADAAIFTNEAAARGLTLAEMAQFLIGVADQWHPLADKIEDARSAAKVNVTAAETREAKEMAAVIDWNALVQES